VVGAVAGLVGGGLAGRQQGRIERERWRDARRDDAWKEKRGDLETLSGMLAKGIHEVTYVAWSASSKDVDGLRADAVAYEATMRSLLPEITSAQATAWGLSDRAFAELRPLVAELFALDAAIGEAIVGLEHDPEVSKATIAAQLEPGRTLHNEIVTRVRSAFRLERQLAGETAPH
jgi:hypothetical protein